MLGGVTIYLTVREMIEQGGFSDFVIHAGASGLDTREVRTVCVVDTVDVEGWLFGGEFLLSSGYIFKENPEQLGALIETANRGNAAALGVKLGRYIDRIPQEVLRVADSLSFPLLGIPMHYAHTDIINPALVTIANRKAEMMDQRDGIWREFFDVVLRGGTVESILELLQKHIHRDILFIDNATGNRHTIATSAEFLRVADEVPLASLIDHFSHETITLDTENNGDKTLGYLFMDRSPSAPDAAIAVEQAKRALQLRMKWERERWKIERGYGAMFVQDILFKRFRHDSEIRSRGRTLGWELSGLHTVALVSVDRERSIQREPHEPHIRAFEIFHNEIRQLQASIPHTLLEDAMAFILMAPPQEWPKIKERLSEIFISSRRQARLKTGLQLIMGVGSPVDNMLSCDKSFWEAKRTLSMARGCEAMAAPLFWEDMGVYKLLSPLLGTRDAAEFVSEQLGPLLSQCKTATQQFDDTLLNTLHCVIRSNWQLKPAADEMNLHYNTIKYRYRKIGETLGQNLESPQIRINLAIAMELYQLGKS